MAEIDSLDIKISAEADKANATLDILVKKLDRVSASLSGVNSRGLATMGAGVNKLSNAMNNFANNTKTADFSRLSRNLGTISDIDTGKFSDLSSKMSQLSSAFNSFGKVPEAAQQIGDFAKNIAKLGNKSVQNAIVNIPKLAVAMDNLMRTLSKSPKVGQNIIDMTKALAALASQGGKVGTASNTLSQNLNKYSVSASKASKRTEGLARKIGRLYATYFWVVRGAKKLWSSIESSFDYLEVLNYFDAAFGQVADNADYSKFGDLGEEAGRVAAQAYHDSFAARAEELTAKMSGFTIGENGLLQSTGAVSLGLDPSQLMNYQAMFGQMSSSMGVASETALKLSQALTEIGADLASVKNLEFETVWNDMASGLAGMSRTLDKYGVNIRNVNLQQKLMELGIDANITALNQNDKALLRAIILLENTKYAWGDLADTINQPANQLRLIQANFENLSRTIGNLFLPLVKTVLPYVNALVIAVQRLFAWLGNLIGIDISGISDAVGGADMGDILDQTDDLTSGLGDAKKQADKLNKSLRQFDELKVINTKQDDGGAGTGAGIQGGLLDAAFEDAFTKYQQEWDKAFGRLKNRAQEIADRIEKAFEPLKKIIQDFAIGDFFQAGQDTSALVAGIFNFFADAIDKVDWNGIGEKIGDFFAGLDWPAIFKAAGNLIWQGLKAAFELYVGAFSTAPLETAVISLVKFPKLLRAIASSSLISKVKKLGKAAKVLADSFSLLKMGIADKQAWTGFKSAIENIRENLSGIQKFSIGAVGVLGEFALVKGGFEDLTQGSENLVISLGKIAGGVGLAVGALKLIGLSNPFTAVIVGATALAAAISGATEANERLKKELKESREIELFGETLGKASERITEVIQGSREWRESSQKYIQESGVAETKFLEDLAKKYFDLYEKQGKSNEELEEMQRIAGLLVEKAPELKNYYDEQTGLIDASRDAVEKLIKARLDEIKLNAVGDKLEESYGKLVDIELELEKATDKRNKAQDELSKYVNRRNELNALKEQSENARKLAEAYGDGKVSVDELSKAYDELGKAYDKAGISNEKELEKAIKSNEEAMRWFGATTLKETTASLNALEEEHKKALEYNQKLMYAYTTGITDSLEETTESAKIGSKVFLEEMGKAASGSEVIASEMVKSISTAFSDLPNTMKKIGMDSMEGFEIGISSMASKISSTAKKIADSVSDSIKKALNINSPSKVMFELGDYTMQGFQKGMENLYQPILSSVKDFSYDISAAPTPRPADMYGDYQYRSAYVTQYGIAEYPQSNYNQSNAETNALLREVLSELRKGHTIELNDGVIAGRTRNIANTYTATQGEPYFLI